MSATARYWLFIEAGWAALAAGAGRIGYQHLAAAQETLPPVRWRDE